MRYLILFLVASFECFATPKLILFDVGGVLVEDANKGLIELIMTEFKSDPSKALAFFQKSLLPCLEKLQTGQIKETDMWKILERETGGVTPSNWGEIFANDYLNQAHLKEDVFKILNRVSECCELAVFSNTIPTHEAVNERRGVFAKFPTVFNSNQLGFRKPDVESFMAVSFMMDLDAKDIVFIDDASENVEAAKRAGMQAFLFESAESLEKILRDVGAL